MCKMMTEMEEMEVAERLLEHAKVEASTTRGIRPVTFLLEAALEALKEEGLSHANACVWLNAAASSYPYNVSRDESRREIKERENAVQTDNQ